MGVRKCLTPDSQRELVRQFWGTRATSEIGNHVGLSVVTVRRIAREMDLPPSPFQPNGAKAQPAPIAPKGYSAATLKWAREAAGVSREAAMILALTGNDVRNIGWR
jgi:hypothetical protein